MDAGGKDGKDVQELARLYEGLLRQLDVSLFTCACVRGCARVRIFEFQSLFSVMKDDSCAHMQTRSGLSTPRVAPEYQAAKELEDLNAVARRAYGKDATQYASDYAYSGQIYRSPARLMNLSSPYGAGSLYLSSDKDDPGIHLGENARTGRRKDAEIGEVDSDDRRKIDLLAERLERMRQRLP